MPHISQKEFETINWLPIKERCDQCINSIAFKYVDNQCPHHLKMQVETQVKMPYVSLVWHCRIKSLKKSKEQLT